MNTGQTIISNETYFKETLNKIKADGLDKIHVLADFDRTLTKSSNKGKTIPSLISLLRSEGYLSEDYSKEAYRLYNKYYPIEINPDISLEEKKKEMVNWWNEHLSLLVNSGLHKRDIESIVDNGYIIFRPGVIEFLKFLNKNNIPIVIISANGLGADSIKMFFEKNGFMGNNVDIISNSFIWDENGNAIGYDERIIHSFNKDETVLHEYPEIFESIKNKTNVILLGDSTGDTGMIEGFHYKNLLKFGFLNEKTEEFLENYRRLYDVVMTEDSDGEFLGKLGESLINEEQN